MNKDLVLVVEDDEDICQLIQTVVEQALGVRTIAAVDGADALEKAWELRPSLILLDLALPGIDGLEVARHLKSRPLTQSTPIVVLSVLDIARARAMELGCDDYVEKPFDIDQLLAKVKRQLGRKAPAAA